ncbi:MAG: radical SAM protein [candidate division WOR-3 bacterium]
MTVLSLQNGIIYGPVNSKRLGRSLGINLLPTTKKVCSFDCIYCHYGKTTAKTLFPEPNELPTIEQIKIAIEQALKSPIKIDALTFSGNGEPMIHPEFSEIVKIATELKNRYRPQIPLTLLSNSSYLVKAIDIDTLSLINNRIFKLDCADQDSFRIINNPVDDLSITAIIDSLAKLAMALPIIIQTVFIDGIIKNYQGEIFDKWLEAIIKIRPQKIQIYSTDRPVANQQVRMVEDKQLFELAKIISKITEIPTTAYPAQKKR